MGHREGLSEHPQASEEPEQMARRVILRNDLLCIGCSLCLEHPSCLFPSVPSARLLDS